MLSRVFGFGRRPFDTLSEQEMLALAISSEEDDGRIYRAYADGLREQFPQSAKVFDEMAEEEDGHRGAADRAAPRAVRRAHPADPPRACARLLRAQAGLAGQAARHRHGARRRPRRWRRTPIASTSRRRSARATPRRASCSAISRLPRSRMRRWRIGSALKHAPRGRAARGSPVRAAAIHPDLCAAGARRA